MATSINKPDTSTMLLPARQRWEAPAIVLERSLQVSAQDGSPGGPQGGPNNFLGPLSASGGAGNCGWPQ